MDGEKLEMGEKGVDAWYYSLHTTVFMLIRLTSVMCNLLSVVIIIIAS